MTTGRAPQKTPVLHYRTVPASPPLFRIVGFLTGFSDARRAAGIILPKGSVTFVNFGILFRGRAPGAGLDRRRGIVRAG